MIDSRLIFNDRSSYELTQPEWLWLIPLFVIIQIILTIGKEKYFIKSTSANLAEVSSKKTLFHPLLNSLSFKTGAISSTSKLNLLYTFIFILIIIALTQPIKTGEKLPEPPQERDITFIVDTSVSMILRDYVLDGKRIDRMSLLKGVLDNFIHKLRGQRMSIIVFGDNAYTLVPLTSDQALLRRMLSRVQATMAGRFNAIGDAIALAVNQATHDINRATTNKRKRILVLLTDADQPTGKINPVIAAQLAKHEKLPLYTIAIGATSHDAEEKRQGGLLYSPVDLKLIQELSSITGGTNYQAGNPNALHNAIQAINSHETNKREVKPQYYRQPLYHWALILAFSIFSFAQLTNIVVSTIKKKSIK